MQGRKFQQRNAYLSLLFMETVGAEKPVPAKSDIPYIDDDLSLSMM